MVLIVNLNTTIDKTHIVNDYKIDRVYRPVKTIKVGGGKGINVARVLNKLKIPYKVIGFLGGVNRGFVIKNFKEEKISFVEIPIKGDSRDITIIIDPINRTETVVNEKGPVISAYEQKLFLKKFKILIKEVKYLAICGSMPAGIPYTFYGKLTEIAKKYGVFTLLDTSDRPLFESIKFGPDLIKPNETEFRIICNKRFPDIKKELLKIYKVGIKYVILTKGRKGCIGFDGKEFIKVKPPKITKISTVGSGDAFTAGLIYSFINEKNFADSLVFATACAAANALKIGAGELNLKDIYILLPKVKYSIF